jgi:carbon-monoxide dehydrogenase small subunit
VQRVIREVPVELRLHRPVGTAPAAAPPAFALSRQNSPSEPAAPLHSTASTLRSAAGTAPVDKGWTRVEDAFVVARSRDEVWRLFGNTARMAACLPGFVLVEESGGEMRGDMRVAFGPIKANFACQATVERADETQVGVLHGGGRDERGGSRAKGRVTYRLVQDAAVPTSTRVDLTLEYQLQGPLAQFSRSGLVRDFTKRLIAAFAQNLSADLSGSQPVRTGAPLGIGSFAWAALRDTIKRWLRRA